MNGMSGGGFQNPPQNQNKGGFWNSNIGTAVASGLVSVAGSAMQGGINYGIAQGGRKVSKTRQREMYNEWLARYRDEKKYAREQRKEAIERVVEWRGEDRERAKKWRGEDQKREDNASQRKIADLKNAGFSEGAIATMAIGGASAASGAGGGGAGSYNPAHTMPQGQGGVSYKPTLTPHQGVNITGTMDNVVGNATNEMLKVKSMRREEAQAKLMAIEADVKQEEIGIKKREVAVREVAQNLVSDRHELEKKMIEANRQGVITNKELAKAKEELVKLENDEKRMDVNQQIMTGIASGTGTVGATIRAAYGALMQVLNSVVDTLSFGKHEVPEWKKWVGRK